MIHTKRMYKKSVYTSSHGRIPLLAYTLDVRYNNPNPTTSYMCLCTTKQGEQSLT